MPELPEVETVRRGLAPVMEGARFDKVEARRGDLRWPLQKDFAKRIEGTTVTGMGRRAWRPAGARDPRLSQRHDLGGQDWPHGECANGNTWLSGRG